MDARQIPRPRRPIAYLVQTAKNGLVGVFKRFGPLLFNARLRAPPYPSRRRGSFCRAAYAWPPMPRTYLVFGDIEGKLDVLRIECTKCGRRGGHYGVAG